MRILAVLLLVGGVAQAEPEKTSRDSRDWHLGIEWMTDFPLTVGAQVWAELPRRIRLSMSFGEMPDLYLDTINAVLVGAGVYNHATADFVSEVLDHAFTWRLHVGWRPFKHRGAYVEAGYGLIEAHANVGVLGVIQLATGLTSPVDSTLNLGYKIDTLVQTAGVELGWIWYPWRNLTVRASVGFAATVGASVDIAPNFLSTTQGVFTRLASDYAEQLIEKYLFVPTVGLAVGWQLF